jgi:hypothetical protein
MEAFVWEPSLMKINAISSAAEAACLTLSVNETVRNPQSEQVHSQYMEDFAFDSLLGHKLGRRVKRNERFVHGVAEGDDSEVDTNDNHVITCNAALAESQYACA